MHYLCSMTVERFIIENVEEALRLFEEKSIKQAQTLETGNYRVGNKCFDNKMKCLSYLYKQGKLLHTHIYMYALKKAKTYYQR